nr:aminopeptidase [Ardenticatenales bacterium]
DKNRIGEMGIGINSEIHAPTGYLLTDEKIMGTVHFAIGHNQFMGGNNKSTMHWDMVMLQPTVTLDDQVLLDDGRFTLKGFAD